MTFLHPGFLYAAGAAAAAVVALHFLVSEQPRAGVLPTVRFFPDVDVRSTALTVRLSDLLLLLVRVLTLLLIGAAFAQPQLKPSRSATLRIVALDASRGVGSASELKDSAAKYLPNAASVIVFDSVAKEVSVNAAQSSVDSLRASSHRGSLSSALIVALRAASRLRERADSIELVVISPLLAEESDSATHAIRALWPGGIRIVRVAAGRDTLAQTAKAATLEWADSSTTTRWVARAKTDTIGGLRFEGGVLVYPFARKWKLAGAGGNARVIARWVDGEPAVVESATGSGCVRSSSIPIPSAGDAILRPSFARFFESISSPCVAAQSFAPMSADLVAAIAGPAHLAPTSAIRPEAARMTPLVPWLLGAALVLALLELLLRRRGERSHAREDEYAAAEATGEYPIGHVA